MRILQLAWLIIDQSELSVWFDRRAFWHKAIFLNFWKSRFLWGFFYLQASSAPGGEQADEKSPNFPQVDVPGFLSLEYNFTKFDNYTLAYRDFEYETNKTMAPLRKIAENKKIEENDLNIDNFINYCTEGVSKKDDCKQGSTQHGTG